MKKEENKEFKNLGEENLKLLSELTSASIYVKNFAF